MYLKINSLFHISDIEPRDKPQYLMHLKEKEIHDQTLNIPYPYTENDADWWIAHNQKATANQGGRSVNWAIRETSTDKLIGGIGFLGLKIDEDHRAELGYWLAKPYWKKGLMTEAVQTVVSFSFLEFNLDVITANAFTFNTGSNRVLQKSGFTHEGRRRRVVKKNGQLFDLNAYSIIPGEI